MISLDDKDKLNSSGISTSGNEVNSSVNMDLNSSAMNSSMSVSNSTNSFSPSKFSKMSTVSTYNKIDNKVFEFKSVILILITFRLTSLK